ncbi:RNA-directed DNA polymerase, eukaryota, partial [Tanacetum coccineum]
MTPSFRSNEDHVRLISKSIFVTNFLDNTTSKDLWKVCQGYGSVVDVYIHNRKSKAGKQFAFVCFIKVDNVDRLVWNLCTLWIGRMHLHANVVRFECSPMHSSRPTHHVRADVSGSPSFASALKGTSSIPFHTSPSPAMVLDDSCVVTRDLDNFVMGEVKQFSSINNLRVLLSNEGFQNVKVAYLGGLWVMFKLESSKSKKKFMQHVGVASWFTRLCNAQSDFVSRERIVWVDIEGVPLHAWSRFTFTKIGNCLSDPQYSKKILSMDDKSVKGAEEDKGEVSKHLNLDAESDVEGVVNSGLDKSIPYPPGFTPEKDNQKTKEQEVKNMDSVKSQSRSEGIYSRILEDAQPIYEHQSSEIPVNGREQKKSGSILEVLDDMIKVGQTMRTWNPNKSKILLVSVYAPQLLTEKRFRYEEERMGSVFNVQGANEFNSFISNSGLVEVQLDGYPFTWSHPSANKMSKLDRFLVTEGFISLFPHNSVVCLDRHLSDHRPILLGDVIIDYEATPFRLYHSWLGLQGFDQMVTLTWNSIVLDDRNGMLSDIDKQLDQGGGNDELLLSRMDLMKQMHDIKSFDARDYMQKAKIQWAIEGDENSKFFHGIINRKRANLSIKGIMVDGEWVTELEKPICIDEIRNAVWDCGENKSSGPDGFTFEFF